MNGIVDFLEAHKNERIALAMHQRPDGDALGSCMGLADVLRGRGYTARVISPFPPPSHLSFIVDEELFAQHTLSTWWKDYDCLGILDCGEEGRLEPTIREALPHLPAFTIDHHATSSGVGQAHWIDPIASSTGEMVVRLCKHAGWRLSPFAAQALWTAIVTDTGRFSYENTNVAALEAARDCLQAGARPAEAAAALYQSVTVPERHLQSVVLERMELLKEGRLAVSWLVREDFHKAGIGVEGAQNLINILRDTEGVEVAIFLYEPGGEPVDARTVKASFRTREPHNALKVTCRFGGGGHQRAAGCSLPGPIAEARKIIIDAAGHEYFPAEQRVRPIVADTSRHAAV